nr:redoxin domain-containing protein [Flavihumibacter fluvii]
MHAQNIAPKTKPVVGEKCPDFQISGIQHASFKKINLERAKGKWLVLHFFSLNCSDNFTSLNQVDSFQRAFKDSVQFVLVGRLNRFGIRKGTEIYSQYEAYRKRFGFELAVAYDSSMQWHFGVSTTPESFLIDPDGIMRAKFLLPLASQEDLYRFMKGDLKALPGDVAYKSKLVEYETLKPLLENDNGGAANSYLFRSILVKSNPQLAGGSRAIFNSEVGRLVQFVNVSLDKLYMMAFGDTLYRLPKVEINSYGRLYHKPVWENRDANKYINNEYDDSINYSYSMVTPEVLPVKRLQENMQRDLKNYFGFDVRVEKRMMPCWKLVASPSARKKLATKGSEFYSGEDDYADFTLLNMPVSKLIWHLWRNNQLAPPFVDSTGIIGNIDIHLKSIYIDSLEKTREALRENGLDIVLDKKEMDVIVIRDP